MNEAVTAVPEAQRETLGAAYQLSKLSAELETDARKCRRAEASAQAWVALEKKVVDTMIAGHRAGIFSAVQSRCMREKNNPTRWLVILESALTAAGFEIPEIADEVSTVWFWVFGALG